jgi:5-methylcytosine-specific restriction endonuclease McrA
VYLSRYHQENRAKHNAQAKEHYRTNRDRRLEQSREWAKANPDRRREISARHCKANRPKYRIHLANYRQRKAQAFGSLTDAEVQAILRKHGNKCVDCGSKDDIELDHRWPVSKGGCNFAYNIEPRCRTCNRVKSAKLIPGVQPSLFDVQAAA